MTKLPQPITTTDFFLAAVIERLDALVEELQKHDVSATQKPVIQLDVKALSSKIAEHLKTDDTAALGVRKRK